MKNQPTDVLTNQKLLARIETLKKAGNSLPTPHVTPGNSENTSLTLTNCGKWKRTGAKGRINDEASEENDDCLITTEPRVDPNTGMEVEDEEGVQEARI